MIAPQKKISLRHRELTSVPEIRDVDSHATQLFLDLQWNNLTSYPDCIKKLRQCGCTVYW